MKSYKDFEKKHIGDSDIAALTLTFFSPFGVDSKVIKFGGDAAYQAYVCEGDVIIGSHYIKVASGKTWLRFYDDAGLSYQDRRDGMVFEIYRAGEYGCVIHWHADPAIDEGMVLQKCGTRFTHVEKFESWLKKTAKNYLNNIEDYLDELEERYNSTESAWYELAGHETKSGNPECYSYDVEEIFDGGERTGRTVTF